MELSSHYSKQDSERISYLLGVKCDVKIMQLCHTLYLHKFRIRLLPIQSSTGSHSHRGPGQTLAAKGTRPGETLDGMPALCVIVYTHTHTNTRWEVI